MEEVMVLVRKVRRVSWKIRFARAMESALRFLMGGLILDTLFLMAIKIIGPPSFQLQLFVLLILGAIAGGSLYGLCRPLPPLKAARLLDQKLNLRERVGTALELGYLKESEWPKAVARDALACIQNYPLWKVKFRSWPREVKILPFLVAILVIIYILPSLPDWNFLSTTRTGILAGEGERLEKMARSLQERVPKQEWDQSRELLSQLENLSQQMQRKRMDLEEIIDRLLALSRAAQKRQQELEGLNIFSEGGKGGESETSPIRGETEENFYRLKLDKLKQLLADMEGGRSGSDLESEIEELSRDLPSGDEIRKSLEEASRALSEGKGEQAEEEMRQAMEKIKKSLSSGQERQFLKELQREIDRSQQQLRERKGSAELSPEEQLPSPPQVIPQQQELGYPPTDESEGGTFAGTEPSAHPEGPPTERLPGAGEEERIPGKFPLEPETSFKIFIPGGEREAKAGAPFREVYPRYRKVAEETLVKERIPLGFREYVKEYFQSLEPR